MPTPANAATALIPGRPLGSPGMLSLIACSPLDTPFYNAQYSETFPETFPNIERQTKKRTNPGKEAPASRETASALRRCGAHRQGGIRGKRGTYDAGNPASDSECDFERDRRHGGGVVRLLPVRHGGGDAFQSSVFPFIRSSDRDAACVRKLRDRLHRAAGGQC